MEGIGDIGLDAKKGKGGLKSGVNVLKGSGTWGALIWLGVLVPVGGNVENSGRDTHRISKKNHRKSYAEEGGRDGGYIKGRGSEISGGNPVRNKLHQKKTGSSGTVGGDVADI